MKFIVKLDRGDILISGTEIGEIYKDESKSNGYRLIEVEAARLEDVKIRVFDQNMPGDHFIMTAVSELGGVAAGWIMEEE